MASPNSPVVMGPRHSGVQLNGTFCQEEYASRLSITLQLRAFRLFAGLFRPVLPFRALLWECQNRTIFPPGRFETHVNW